MKKLVTLFFLISTCAYSYPVGVKATGQTTVYPALIDLGFLKATNSGSTFTLNSIGAATGDSLVLGGTINANALLDIQSTTKAFMPPRMTTTQKNAISSPTAGMVVYDSTLGCTSYYNGASWINLIATTASTANATDFSWQVSSTGAVSGENLDVVNGNCTNANPSVCTFNSSIFTVAPNCTTTITNTAANLALTSPASSSSTTVTIQQNSSIVATQEPFAVHCQKSGVDYTNAVAGGVVASNLIGYAQVPGVSSGSIAIISFSYGTTNLSTVCSSSPCFLDQIGTDVTSVTRSATATYVANFARTYTKLRCTGSWANTTNPGITVYNVPVSCNSCNSFPFVTSSNLVTPDTYGTFLCIGSY